VRASQYHVDLEGFSLEKFRRNLESGEVLPGRKVLKEKIPERFQVLKAMGITNLKELMEALKTKKRLEKFAQESGLSQDYLVILRREANSHAPNPVNLRAIPGVAPKHVEKLAAVGIKHTKHLFDRAKSGSDRAELSGLADVPESDLLELLKLSDLARVSGVGPVFARLLYEAGAHSLAELVRCAPDELCERVNAINQEKGYTQVTISLRDIVYCVEIARELPKVIEYE